MPFPGLNHWLNFSTLWGWDCYLDFGGEKWNEEEWADSLKVKCSIYNYVRIRNTYFFSPLCWALPYRLKQNKIKPCFWLISEFWLGLSSFSLNAALVWLEFWEKVLKVFMKVSISKIWSTYWILGLMPWNSDRETQENLFPVLSKIKKTF